MPRPSLPEFVARFRDILQQHGTDGAFYGHASVGCLHIRPLLNLKRRDDVARMRRITADVTDLVLEYRRLPQRRARRRPGSQRVEREDVRPGVYRGLPAQSSPRSIRTTCSIPARSSHAPPMTDNLRYPPGYDPVEPPTVFDYSKQAGFPAFHRNVQRLRRLPQDARRRDVPVLPGDARRSRQHARPGQCTCGTRLTAGAAMPDLAHVPPALRSKWVHEIFDLCLMCKACKSECPSNVDVAKLKAEFLQFYYRGRPRPLGHLVAANIHRFNRLAAPLAPLVNWLQSS